MNSKPKARALLTRRVHRSIGLDRFFTELKRGGQYLPLFARHSAESGDERLSIWLNSWLITPDKKSELEREQTVHIADYFQHGFHPEFWTSGRNGGESGYDTLYGRNAEPLVLGWSADHTTIDATLSQEFERFYGLTATVSANGTRWASHERAMDDVVVREVTEQLGSVVAHADYLRDFQDVRQRWLLVAYWSEWRQGEFRHAMKPDRRVWAERRRHFHREWYFGLLTPEGADLDYVEAKGYRLYPPPVRPQFSRTSGEPKSVAAASRHISLLTSEGRVRVSRVKEARHQDTGFSATAIFDQQVLQKYQDEGAQLHVDHLNSLTISSRRVGVSRMAWMLGTEYVSIPVGYFVEGVPEMEWTHWQGYNRAWIGSTSHRELMAQPTLFTYSKAFQKLPLDLNLDLGRVFPDIPDLPFAVNHPLDKDLRQVERALPRQSSLQDLLQRAQAIDAAIVQRLSAVGLRVFLVRCGYDPVSLEHLGSLKLFSAVMAVLAVAGRDLRWNGIHRALKRAVTKYTEWEGCRMDPPVDEDTTLIAATVRRMEPLFGVHALRLLSAHPSNEGVEGIFRKHFSRDASVSGYRDAILTMYRSVVPCLESAIDE